MKKRTGIFAILIAILALGIGYAAISSVTLNVNNSSSAKIEGKQENFDVVFKTDTSLYSATGNGTATFTRSEDGHDVTFTLTGFTKRGDRAVVTIPFENISETLEADLSTPAVSFDNETYFNVTLEPLSTTTLAEAGKSGSDSELVLTIEAIKTPVTDEETTSISVTLQASPKN